MKAYKIDLSGFTGKVREVISEAVQKKAFTLGYTWSDGDGFVKYLESSWLDFWSDGTITKCYYDAACIGHVLIPADVFLALTTAKDEPSFKPFDKVLVRDSIDDEWMPDFYAHPLSVGHCVITGGEWSQCIPYKGNEALLGTTDSPE